MGVVCPAISQGVSTHVELLK